MKIVDSGILLSKHLSKLMNRKKIPLKVFTDSMYLLDYVSSTKQIEEKHLILSVAKMKQLLEDGYIDIYSWIE